ncbi:MAG: GspE/PulE family protein [Planctomycetota bacterium]
MAEAAKFADLTRFKLSREQVRRLEEEFCRSRQAVLLGEELPAGGDAAPLGMLDVTDDATAREVEERIGRKVRRVQLNAFELDTAMNFGFSTEAVDPEEGGSSITLDIGTGRLILTSDLEICFEREQSAAEMVASLLSVAVARRASDIHIETYTTDVDVRLRVDGVLQQLATPISHGNVRRVCSYIKVLAGMDITEQFRDQDGRISTVYRDADGTARQIDMRVSILPGPHGSDLVLRVLDSRRIGIGLDDLGLSPAQRAGLGELIRSPGGLIIVAGPTASGKTTTLYAAIRDINTDANKILTVEDPIEYEVPRVNQKQVSEQMSFAAYARAFMRQNPDVLMIGEIRDEPTAEIALRASQMGHLVFTTLHARDVGSALNRLLVLCEDTTLLASGLVAILSQRLVRRVCAKCAEACEPAPEVLRRLPGLPEGVAHVRGRGCEACAGTGYLGQVGVFEVLPFDDELRRGVWEGRPLEPASVPGFRPMIEEAYDKLAAGITTAEEIARNVPAA